MLTLTRVEYRGKVYEVERQTGETASGEAPAGAGLGTWHVKLGPTAITSFDADPSDTEDSVQARVLEWLDDHPDLNDRDRIHLGGG